MKVKNQQTRLRRRVEWSSGASQGGQVRWADKDWQRHPPAHSDKTNHNTNSKRSMHVCGDRAERSTKWEGSRTGGGTDSSPEYGRGCVWSPDTPHQWKLNQPTKISKLSYDKVNCRAVVEWGWVVIKVKLKKTSSGTRHESLASECKSPILPNQTSFAIRIPSL